MEKVEKPIIVPWDFTPVVENAFLHALHFSRMLKREIILLHIANEEKEVAEKENAMMEAVENIARTHGTKPGYLVELGNIFHTIGAVATEHKAEMIIMGTHGLKGAQKLFGSRAVKVVVSSRIPFLIVQDKPAYESINNILLPIDFKKENKEKANWILYLTSKLETKVTIFKSQPKDKGFKKKLLSNMRYIEKYLKNNDIDFDIVACTGKKKFKEEVVEYAHSNNFDLILVMATRDIKLMDYLFGAPEQYIIANKYSMPVMCINPRPMKIAGGFRATGSA